MAPALALVVLLLSSGYLARRFQRLPDQAAEVLNRFVIDICVPATILRVVPTLTPRWELSTLIVVPWALALLAYLLARGVGRLLSLDRQTQTAFFLCTALSNTSFLGFPLCRALLGEESLSLAAVYDQLGSFLLLCVLVPVTIAHASGVSAPRPAQLLRGVVTFPPFVALLLALLPWQHPAWLDGVLREIGAALVPVAMFAVGLRLRITPPVQRTAFALGLVCKLALLPLAAWGLTRALRAPSDILEVAVLESAMPAMISAGAALMSAGLATELTAALVGWGVLAGLVTVPLWAALLR
jgi:predicted permease